MKKSKLMSSSVQWDLYLIIKLLVITMLISPLGAAECGWVLWWKTDTTPNPKERTRVEDSAKNVKLGQWKPDAAFDTRQECISSMYRAHSKFKQSSHGYYQVGPPEPLLIDNKMIIGLYYPHRVDLNRLECWPSNIRPE
jgi:hypothetical protein